MHHHPYTSRPVLGWCAEGRAGKWRSASEQMAGAVCDKRAPLSPDEIEAFGAAVSEAPACFVEAAASFLEIVDEPNHLPWAVIDGLFGHALAGMELALGNHEWRMFLAYAEVALQLPCGTRTRHAVLEVTFRSVLSVKASEPTGELAEMLAELEVAIANSAQYPDLLGTLHDGSATSTGGTKPADPLASISGADARVDRDGLLDRRFIAACDELAWHAAAEILTTFRPKLDRLSLNPQLSRAFQLFVTSAPNAALFQAQLALGETGGLAAWRTEILKRLSASHLKWAQRFMDWGDYGLAHAHTAAAIMIRGRTQEHESQINQMGSLFVGTLRKLALPDLRPLFASE